MQPYFYTNTTSFTYVFIVKIASKVVSTFVIVLITLGCFCNVTNTIVLVQCTFTLSRISNEKKLSSSNKTIKIIAIT
jgi:hypothetical protein